MQFLDINGVKRIKRYTDDTFVTSEDVSEIEDASLDFYTKSEIDEMISDVEAEIQSGGGGITSETDPVFTASPAHGITSANISTWNAKQNALVSGTNIKTINKTSLLGSGNIDLVPYGATLMPTNPFGGRGVYINSIDNAFHSADKRFWVKITLHSKTVSGVTYPYADTSKEITDPDYWVDSPVISTLSNASNIFDGSYESPCVCPVGQYMKIHIQFSPFSDSWNPSTAPRMGGYPYGSYYLSYYYQYTPGSLSQLRVYNIFATHTIGWHLYSPSVFSGSLSGNYIECFTDNGDYSRTCVEFIIFGKDSGSSTYLTQIDYQLSRPDLASSGSTVTKYGAQSLYHNFGWYKHNDNAEPTNTVLINATSGSVTASSFVKSGGTSSQFLKADGSVDSNSYATTSALSAKQDALVSGTNIKTINGTSILGNGNISISGTGGGEANVIETVKVNGTALTPDSNKAVNVTVPTKVSDLTDDVVSGSYLPLTGGNMDSGALIRLRNSSFSMVLQPFGIVKESNEQSHALYLPDKSGTIALTSDLPTKVSDLTNDSGFTTNTGTITGITMNGASKGTSGVVDLGTVLTSFTETDPIFSASAASGITASDITNWNNKLSTAPVTSVNGNTGAVTITAASLGAATTASLSNYLPLTGGTITGNLNIGSTANEHLTLGSEDLVITNSDDYQRIYGFNRIGYYVPSDDETHWLYIPTVSGTLALTSQIPSVPSWALAATKPTYTASEVGALPSSTTIPSTLSSLSDDSTHRTVTDTEKATWNAKQNAITISSSEPTSSQGSNGDIWIVI